MSSPSDSVLLDMCFLGSPSFGHGNLKGKEKNLVVLDTVIDRIAEKQKPSSLGLGWIFPPL